MLDKDIWILAMYLASFDLGEKQTYNLHICLEFVYVYRAFIYITVLNCLELFLEKHIPFTHTVDAPHRPAIAGNTGIFWIIRISRITSSQ